MKRNQAFPLSSAYNFQYSKKSIFLILHPPILTHKPIQNVSRLFLANLLLGLLLSLLLLGIFCTSAARATENGFMQFDLPPWISAGTDTHPENIDAIKTKRSERQIDKALHLAADNVTADTPPLLKPRTQH